MSQVKVILRSKCRLLTFYQQMGGGPLTERHSSLERMLSIFFHFNTSEKHIETNERSQLLDYVQSYSFFFVEFVCIFLS